MDDSGVEMADFEFIRKTAEGIREEAAKARTALEGTDHTEAVDLKPNVLELLRQTEFLARSFLALLSPPPPLPSGPPPLTTVQLQEMDRRAAINRIWVETNLKSANERSKHVIEIGMLALKSVFLVNGAAIVALLTFLGTVRGPANETMMRVAFADFGVGLVLALVATGVAYITQQLFTFAEQDKAGAVYQAVIQNSPERPNAGASPIANVLQVVGFCLAAGSLLLFIMGAFAALDALFAAR